MMTYTAVSCFGRFTVENERHEKLGGWKHPGIEGRTDIYTADGRLFCSICRKKGSLSLTAPHCPSRGASIDYRPSVLPVSLVRPPMAESLRVDSSWGRLHILQTPRRSFRIYLDGKEIGTMTGMLSARKVFSATAERLPDRLCLILFPLALFMLHDSDVDIV